MKVIVRIISKTIPSYYHINNKYSLADNVSRVMCRPDKSEYKFDIISELSTSSQLIRKTTDNNFDLLNISSIDYKVENKVFYAIELDGDDIFYSDDLLVHS